MNLDKYHQSLRQSVPAGTLLLQQGTRSGKLYILLVGRIDVVRDQVVVASISEAGAMFGEMSALLDIPHTANVVAASDATLLAFTDAASFLQSDPDVALTVARKLAQRLNTVTGYLVDIKRQYAGQSNHLGMVSQVLASLVYQQAEDFTPGSDRDPGP